MPTKQWYLERIEDEFAAAMAARRDGNEGRARVCARRAVGLAVLWVLSRRPDPGWGTVAIRQIEHIRDEPSFPPMVREAASRLSAKISEQFSYPAGGDPVADARLIISFLESFAEKHAP